MQSIKQLLRDQVWQAIGVFIAVVFGLASLYIFYIYQREIYDFQVVVLANSSLVQIESSIENEIHITYKDQQANNLSLIQVKLENTGNQTIREEDFATPLKFIFPNISNLIEASIVETDPENLKLTILRTKNIGTIQPTLFNKGDKAIVRFLVIDLPEMAEPLPFTVDARIANIKEVQLLNAIDEGFFSSATSAIQSIAMFLAVISTLVSTLTGFSLNNLWKKQTRKTKQQTYADAFENRSQSQLNSE